MGANVSYCPGEDDGLPYDGNSLCVARSLQFIPLCLFFLLSCPSLVYLYRLPPATGIVRRHFRDVVRWSLMLVLLLVSIAEIGQVLMFNIPFFDRRSRSAPIGLYLPLCLNILLIVGCFFVAHLVAIRRRYDFLSVLVVTWACSCATRAVMSNEYRHWPDAVSGDVRPRTCYVALAVYLLLFVVDSYLLLSEWRRSRQSNYDTSKTRQQKDNEEDVANLIFQDAYVNLLSKVTYWWFGKHILQVGFKRPLQQSDFGPIPKEDSSDTAYKLLKVSWQNELIRAHIDCRPPSINWALARTLWRPTLLAAFFILMANALLFYGPLAVNLIVKYAEDYEDGNLPDYTDTLSFQEFFSNGFVVAVTVFVTTVASTLFMHSHHIIMFRVGVFMQTSIRTLVYEKALRLANWTGEKSELTTGLLLNHMSSDTEAFPHLGFLLNQIWAVPLTVLVVIVLLVINLGWSALIACIVIIALLPVQAKVATALARYQRSNLKLSDDRLKKVNELLQGMKLLKLYAWEESFRKATESVRNSELGILLRVNLLRAIVLFVTAVTPVLVTLVAFGMYTILSDNPLTPAKAFTALALFNMMRAPMILLPFMVNMTVSSLVSLKRLNKFFQARELNQPLRHQSLSSFKLETVHSELPEGIEARISKGSFSWDAEQQDPTLSDISLNFPKGKLTMIVGRVGSGKSSLLSALLGEMTTASGTITWRDKNAPIAYGAQKAWLLNDSLKQNILFGKQLDDKKYREIVDACALKPDIEILPAGDDTEIGEKGINLSGGQKQRVSVARAIYSNASVVLLDDPLSAVDVHVAEQMFEKGIINLLLKQGRTVILATHHLRYLQQADMIVVMEGGHVSHVGTFSKICQENAHLSEVFQRGGSLDDSEEDDEQGEEGNHVAIGPTYEHQASQDSAYSNQKKQDQKSLTSQLKGKRSGQLMSKEERETGSVDLRVYLHYFRSFGVSLLLLVIFSVILNDGLQAGTDFWLSDWSTANISDPNERGTDYYVGGYGILSSLTVLAGFVFSLSFAFASIRASKHLHASMLNRLVLAPMRFFETTPVGRVLNRFSSDTKSMDSILPITIQLFLQTVLRVITAFVVQAIVTPFFLLAGIPIFIVFCIIQYYFRRSQREIQRIVSITRSPIYANFSEMLGGLSTIRAYRRQGDFRKKVRQEINDHANAVVFLQTGNRWLGVRLDILGGLVVFFAALSSLSAVKAGTIGAGLVGLSVSYSLKIAVVLNWLVRHITDTEVHMNAVERIDFYSRIAIEPQLSPEDIQPPENWPDKGEVEIRNLQVRYSKELGPVLHGVDVNINGGEKVGICGRTGSGKSSMMLGLFRIIEICGGEIKIDGINISNVALGKLRSRLAIIPQDPVLFAGSVRYNLDPLNEHSDAELWESLKIAQLNTVVSSLENEVTENGDNFSVGQRQLFCLARAFLRKTQILVMDEATASVDTETDAIIQNVIRKVFTRRTVLTIAHRVTTILDSDHILVLDNGKLIENDSPQNLLAQPGSAFASLVQSKK